MKLLFIGDIVGKSGRTAVRYAVPKLRAEHALAAVVANGENAAAGSGITPVLAAELSKHVDVITLGDHTWDQKGFETQIGALGNVVRPANFKSTLPGAGVRIFRAPIGLEYAVIVLQGRLFMKECAYCPFETVEKILKETRLPKTVIVDMHGEATSEKRAMGYFLDGRVSAVLGTHTHVQTNDAEVLPKGTAYLTDVGMTGAHHSILGRKNEDVLYKFTEAIPRRLDVEENYPYRMDSAVLEFNPATGLAQNLTPLHTFVNACDTTN